MTQQAVSPIRCTHFVQPLYGNQQIKARPDRVPSRVSTSKGWFLAVNFPANVFFGSLLQSLPRPVTKEPVCQSVWILFPQPQGVSKVDSASFLPLFGTDATAIYGDYGTPLFALDSFFLRSVQAYVDVCVCERLAAMKE